MPLPFGTAGGIRFADQIRFDPLDFTRGLARVFVRDGGRLFENTRVRRIHDRRGGVTIETASGRIEAEHVVLATHAPLFGFLSLQTRAHPHQSYVIAARVRAEVEDALYRDEQEPYHYIRVLGSTDPRVLLIGGWNAAAKTWDCPCHGGRYDAYGRVIAAPPKDNLEPHELG